ncbi:MAG: hypothetical protein IT370_03670 [Deltaproteobacteria bacterium]|nr:hypothetical protein [Deltaproteobacteria bacterium]
MRRLATSPGASLLVLALAVCALVVTSAGCRGRKRTQVAPPAGQGELTTALASLEQSLTAAVAARRIQRCSRPPAPTSPSAPATATDASIFNRAMVALTQPTGALAECSAAVSAAKDSLKASLSDCPPGASGPCPGRALDDPASLSASVATIELACGALRGQLAAAAHPADEVCSPFRPGLDRAPDPTAFLYLSRAATVLARADARNGQAVRGLDLLLDTLATGQELGRGGVGLSLALAGSGAAGFVAPTAELILQTSPPTPAALPALAARLDHLLAAEPPLAEHLAADAFETQAMFGPSPGAAAPPPSREDAIARLAADAQSRTALERCPAAAPLATCIRGLAEPGLSTVTLAAYPAALRPELEAHLADELAPPAAGYARRYGLRLALLTGLRVHVELLRLAPRGCPAVDVFSTAPLSTLLAPAGLGDRLTVKQVAEGIFELYAPAFLSDDGVPRQVARIDAGCDRPG